MGSSSAIADARPTPSERLQFSASSHPRCCGVNCRRWNGERVSTTPKEQPVFHEAGVQSTVVRTPGVHPCTSLAFVASKITSVPAISRDASFNFSSHLWSPPIFFLTHRHIPDFLFWPRLKPSLPKPPRAPQIYMQLFPLGSLRLAMFLPLSLIESKHLFRWEHRGLKTRRHQPPCIICRHCRIGIRPLARHARVQLRSDAPSIQSRSFPYAVRAIPASKHTAPSKRLDDASPGGDSDVLKFRYLLPISWMAGKETLEQLGR